MTRRTSVLVALILSAHLAFQSPPAAAAETSHFRLSGHSLIGVWLTTETCWVAVTTVRFVSSVIQTDGQPQVAPGLLVDVDFTYVCGPGGEGDPERFVLTGFIPAATWWIRGDLGVATLSGKVIVSDGAGVSLPVAVNLSFAATGELATVHDTFQSSAEGTVVTSRFRFSRREAQASGSVVAKFPVSTGDLTVNLTGGYPSLEGSIGKDVFGSSTVTKN